MAKANTYELEQSGYIWEARGCIVCGKKTKEDPDLPYKNTSPHRLFYYPTLMNGDAKFIGDFCDKHKYVGKRLKRNLEN